MTAFFVILLLALIAPYAVVTLLARSKVTMNANPVTAKLEADDLPEDVVRHFAKAAPALSTNEFEPATYFSIADFTPGTFAFVAFWINAKAQDVATVKVVIGGGGGGGVNPLAKKLTVSYTDFFTLFDNGLLIATSNNPEPSWWKPMPNRDVVQVRDVESAAVVYRLHQNRAMRLKPQGVGKFVPAPGEEINWYRRLSAENLQQQARAGYLEDGGGGGAGGAGVYRLSWLGACVFASAQLPPWKQVLRWRTSEKAEAELKLARGTGKGVL